MPNRTTEGALSIGPELTHDVARRRAASVLAAVSGSEAALDARILLEEAAGLDRAALVRDGDARLGEPAATRFQALLARRLAGEPVWRILGRREFWGLSFAITPAVLDPRPDTETVVGAAVEALRARRTDPLRILDLGTGSGALLCAICSEFPNAQGWGVDRSHAACTVAQRNVAALGLAGRVLIVNGDWAEAFAGSSFDLIVSNPPYIETGVIATLAPEVRNFDPHVALDGGSDGLAAYRDHRGGSAAAPRTLGPRRPRSGIDPGERGAPASDRRGTGDRAGSS